MSAPIDPASHSIRAAEPEPLRERAPEAIVVLDPHDGRFVMVDAEAELLFGIDRERLTTAGPTEVSPPSQPDGRSSDAAATAYIEQAMHGEMPVFRWIFRRADGDEVAREVRLRALPGPDGRTLVLGSITGAPTRDAPQERLGVWDALEARDPHAAFIASLHDGFEMMGRDGTILDVNERFAEIVGMPRDAIIGLRPPFPWWFAEGPERSRVEQALASVIHGGSGEFDFTFRRPDGRTVDVILNANEVVGSDGERLGLVAIVKDVSDRVAAQAERDELVTSLAEERSQLATVLQRLSRLQGFTASIAERLTQTEVVESLMSAAREAVHASGAGVILLTEDDVLAVVATDGELDPAMIPPTSSPTVAGDIQEAFRTGRARWLEPRPRGEGAPDDRWGPIPLGKGFSGRIAGERTPVVVDDVSRFEIVSPWLRERLRSVVGVPIFRADDVVGVLHVGSTSYRRFDRGDIELLELVAARVGGALERARLFESARAA